MNTKKIEPIEEKSIAKKKLSKEEIEYKEGVASFNVWMKQNKKLEDMGLHGTDYYVRRVKELEAQVKRLEAKLTVQEGKTSNIAHWEE